MTKALHCRACNSIHSLAIDGSITSCDCGKVQGWWHDAENGLAYFHTPDLEDRQYLQVISVHNGFLNDGVEMIPQSYYDGATQKLLPYTETQKDEFWRQLHQQAGLAPRAPDHVRVFDAARRSCPFAIVTPGTSVDCLWANEDHLRAKAH